jgi:integration host factor subunit beta
MVKSELVKRIATRRPLLLERQVEKVMNVLLTEIAVALMSGDRVELRGLGIFSVRRRQPRMAHPPRVPRSG